MSARQRRQAAESAIRVIGLRRCSKAALLGGTALRAAALVVLATPASAQLAAGAHPAGGVVVGGSASIGQSGNTTAITQKSGRAAIDWQSFNVGSAARVTFAQPSSSSVVLNTVVGPNPSEIAGRITANGVVAIVNQSGVIFDQGSQVDTAGLVVSASGMNRQNFMAGRMVFDQAPHPGASVVNNGTITIRQAGLAALVAPQVVNNGLISARLGRVVLAGATTYTLDLYGDGLLALNVTGQVTAVQLGGRTIPALVTNAGTILAHGGSVMLNASAADGLIRTLVEAGGTIANQTVGSQVGRVVVQGTGGSVDIAGAVSATGVAAGTIGGTIVANATGTVSLAGTARLDASGDAGGGLVAIGTTAARAKNRTAPAALTAQATTVAAGARIAANAMTRGNGGQVALLATGHTSSGGAITVLGGAEGGNGGTVEISGQTADIGGLVDSRAAHGTIGSLLTKSATSIVVSNTKPATANLHGFTWVDAATNASTGVTLEATGLTGDIDFAFGPGGNNTVASTGTAAGQIFSVTSDHGNINIDKGFTLTSLGSMSLKAAVGINFDQTNGQTLFSLGTAATTSSVLAGPAVSMTAPTDISFGGASITGSTSLSLTATDVLHLSGSISGSGVVTSPLLSATAGAFVALTGANVITSTGTVVASTGAIAIDNAGALTILGPMTASAGSITIAAGALTIDGAIAAGSLLSPQSVSLTTTAGGITEATAGSGAVTGSIAADTLTGSTAGSGVLQGPNRFGTLGNFAAQTNLFILDQGALHVTGKAAAATGALAIDSTGPSSLLDVTASGSLAAGGGSAMLLAANSFDLVGTITTTGLVAIDTSGPHALILGGLGDTFGGHGIASIEAGTLTLGSLNGTSADPNVTSLGINQNIGSAGLTLGLFANGPILEATAVSITAALLRGGAAGDVSLTGSLNAITALGPFASTGGGITISDHHALTVSGSIAGTKVALSSAGGISQTAGTIDATTGSLVLSSQTGDVTFGGLLEADAGMVSLSAGGGIGDSAGGTQGAVHALSLFGTAAAGSIVIADGAANSYGTVTGMAATGSITLADSTGFQLIGPLTGGAVSLTAGGAILQSAGSLTVSSLTGSASGNVSLATAGDNVTTLGDFTSDGFTLTQAGALSVSGTVQAGASAVLSTGTNALTVGGSLAATATSLTAGALSIPGSVTGSSTLALKAASIGATGSIDAGTLTGTITNGATLTGANSIAHLGSFSATDLKLNTTADLSVTGSVTGTHSVAITDTGALTLAAAGSIAGSTTALNAAAMTLLGTIDAAASATLTASTGTISQTAGGLTTALLTGAASGPVSLAGTNSITGLGGFVVTGGGFKLVDTHALTVSGSVSTSNGGAATTLSLSAPSITVQASPGTLVATGGTISLATDTLTLTGGVSTGAGQGLVGIDRLTAGTLTVGASGFPDITTGTLSLGSVDGVTSSGRVTAIDITGPLDIAGGLALFTSGSLTAVAGLVVGTLTGSARTVDFAGAETIGTLKDFAVTNGGLTLSDTGTLILAGSIDIGGTADFTAAGDITERTAGVLSGALTATSLTGSASGLIDLGGTANSISSVAGLTAAAGPLTLQDAHALGITGQVTTPGALTLASSAGVTETAAGLLSAGTLTGLSGGDISLASANVIGTLGVFGSTGGSVALTDNSVLSVSGSLSALTGLSLSVTGTTAGAGNTLAIGADIAAASITLAAPGEITQSAGTIKAGTGSIQIASADAGIAFGGTLAATAGTVALTAAGDIAETDGTHGLIRAISIAGTSTAGDFVLDNASNAFTNVAAVSGNAVTLADGGSMLLTGPLSGGTVKLTSGGDITEAAAAGIAATSLAGSATGSIVLTSAHNAIGTLATSTAGGNFALTDGSTATPGTTLTVTGTISGTATAGPGAPAAIALAAPGLKIATGTLTAPGGTITLATDGLVLGGVVSTGASLGLVGIDSFAGSTLTIAAGAFNGVSTGILALGSLDGTAASGHVTTIDIEGALDLSSNAPTLGLFTTAAGTVASATGIRAQTLTGDAGSVSLTGANAIATLARFIAAGNFTLQDSAETLLTVSGPVSGLITSISAGNLDLPGTLTGATTLTLIATSGTISETGSLNTPLLTGSAFATAALDGTTTGTAGSNSVTALGSFSSAGFSLTDNTGLSIGGTVTGGAGGVAISTLGTTGITITGSVQANTAAAATPGTITLTSGGAIEEAAGALTASALAGSATGTADLSGTNQFAHLANFTADGLTIHDASALAVDGTVTSPTAVIQAASLDITGGGALDAATSLSLTSTAGGITEEGSIATGSLTGSSGTGATTLSGSNSITTLGAFTADGFTLDQDGALTVAGRVQGGSAATLAGMSTLSVAAAGSIAADATSLSAGSLALQGAVTGSNTLTLTAGALDAGGAITAGTLTGTVTNDATFSSPGNAITAIGDFTAEALSLSQASDLAIIGRLTGTNAIDITLASGTYTVAAGGSTTSGTATIRAAAIDVLGSIDATTHLDLVSTGTISEQGGGITTALLDASAAGTLSLVSSANAVGTIGTIGVTGTAAGDGFFFGQTGALTLAGPIGTGNTIDIASGALLTNTGNLTSSAVTLTGGSLAIGGDVSASQSTELAATAAGITETGSISTGTLTGSAVTGADLSGANTIASLGSFTAASLTLIDPGATTLTTTGSIHVTGALSLKAPAVIIGSTATAGTASLTATGGTISEDAAGQLHLGALSGSSSGATTLDGANLIASLGSFTASGFSLTDAELLDVAGPVQGGASAAITVTGAGLTVSGSLAGSNTTLAAQSIGLGGTITAPGTLSLTAAGAPAGASSITQSGSGTIVAGRLTGSAQGSASLVGANTITTLGDFNAAPFTLDVTGGLTVAGFVSGSYTPVSGPAVTGAVDLDVAQALAIAGTISAVTVDLTAASITETGILAAGVLTGGTTGQTSLTSAHNRVTALGSFTAAGFTLIDDTPLLTIGGPVAAHASADIANTGSLLLSGSLTALATTLSAGSLLSITGHIAPGSTFAGSTVALSAGTTPGTGTLTETGSIATETLTGDIQGVATLSGNGSNSISVLGSFTATGGLTLVDNTALTILGPVDSGPLLGISTPAALTVGAITGSIIALSGSAITIDGAVTAATSLGLTATGLTTLGTIAETGAGVILTPLFTASASDAITLSGANAIQATGDIDAGAFTLADTVDLAVGGTLAGGSSAALTDAGHAISVNGTIVSTSVAITAGDIIVPGTIDGAGTVSLEASATGTAAGTILETGSLITADLSGGATRSASFLSATDTNAVAVLGSFTAAGFVLNDSTALTVAGVLQGGAATTITSDALLTVAGSIAGSTTSLTGTAIALGGTLSATALALAATAGGIIGSESASITATSLTGTAAGAVLLTGGNTLTTLGSFTSAGFTLADSRALDVTGPLEGGTLVALTAASLTVPGAITADTLALTIAGAVAETGTIDVASLTGSVTGVAAFTGSNAIGTLGRFAAAALILDDAAGLVVAGPVTSGATTLSAATIDVPGAMTATNLVLTSAGSIAETGTLIVSGTLSGSASGSASLTGAASNSIATLGDFSAAGLTLDDQGGLAVIGAVDGHSATALSIGGALTVGGSIAGATTSLAAATLDVPGAVTASTALSLSIGGTIAADGRISTALLTGTAGGSAAFTGDNSIAALGPFTASALLLDDTADLAIVGAIDGGSSVAIAGTGGLSIASSITAGSIAVSASTIGETGSLATGTLTGSATGSASFAGSNSIATLGDFTAGAGFTLADMSGLTVSGALSGGPSVAITDAAGLTVTGHVTGATTALTATSIDILAPVQAPSGPAAAPGTIDAATSLVLTATTGTITETGSINTAFLTGRAAGSAAFDGTNLIGTLGDFSAGGLAIRDNTDLAVAGAVSGGPSISISDAGTLSVTGTLAADHVALSAEQITATGSIDAAALDAAAQNAAGGGGIALTGLNQIASIGSISSGGFVLADQEALTIEGAVSAGGEGSVTIADASTLLVRGSIGAFVTTLSAASIDIPGSILSSEVLSMTAGGAITESGAITTRQLQIADPTGSVSLTGGNAIAELGGITAAGLTLNNASALAVVGMVDGQGSVTIDNASSLTIQKGGALAGDTTSLATGGLTIDGQITAATRLDLAVSGAIAETGGIATGLLAGSARGDALLAGANRITGMGDFFAGGNFALQDNAAVTLNGALNARGAALGIEAAGITELAGASIVTGVPGDSATSGVITLGSPGEISLGGMMEAPNIIIGNAAGTPTLVTWSGNTVITGASEVPGSSKPPFPAPSGATPGVYVLADGFVQTGTTRVNPNGAAGTIEISLAKATGTVLFDPSPSAGLLAPRSELFLNLNFGSAAGHIVVAGLSIAYILPGANVASNLFGTVDGENGPAASGAAFIKEPNPNYRLNSCPISSVNCILVSPVIVPVTNPVDDVEVTSPRRRRDDDDLIIPNVGEQDF